YADFSPKPLPDQPGSGFHINMSVKGPGEDRMHHMMGGILERVSDMTRFLNPCPQSYNRLGAFKAPKYISWSNNNRSMLIRIPAAAGEYRRVELRSPDCAANPYLAFALLIWAGLDGIQNRIDLPEKANVNLYTAEPQDIGDMETLPLSLGAAT
ncbi:MAG TPA: type I glutamate--ammonia ligase, partial [Clostridiales bacterium]|nr:type I glutamate--ammonia ligase [Clostridiales bacterium]